MMFRKLILLSIFFLLMPTVISSTTFYEGDFFSTGVGEELEQRDGSGEGIPPICNPLWICGEWSECSARGIRSRDCVDLNGCNSDENPPLLLSCLLPLPGDRITGCVTFPDLNILIGGWKNNVYRFDVVNDAINHWRFNIDC